MNITMRQMPLWMRWRQHIVLVYTAVLASAVEWPLVRFNDEMGYVYMARRKVVCIS